MQYRNLLLLFCISLFALLSPSLQAAQLHALLIGINYQGVDPHIPPLAGAVQDVNALRRLMTGPLRIPQEAIRTLTEQQATRNGILQQIQDWLIDGTTDGDNVFLMFAGHGVQIPDLSGKQSADPDKHSDITHHQVLDIFGKKQAYLNLAEALVSFDTHIDPQRKEVTNLILDSEIHQLLSQLKGRQVFMWFDSCHSGGITRDISTRFQERQITLPWSVAETRITDIPRERFRGITIGEDWPPDYSYFAAARYFQKALEEDGHGLFTLALTELLSANPGARYTNNQLITALRNFLEYRQNIPPATQEPVYYGPPHSGENLFPLFTPEVIPEKLSHSSAPPLPTATRIHLLGTGWLSAALRAAIREHSQELVIDAQRPDLVLEINAQGAALYHSAGQLLQTFPAAIRPVLDALLAYHTTQQMGNLHNPVTPFEVELWLDSPGKTQFKRNDRVTLYYRVKALPYPKAYLTLLNLSPNSDEVLDKFFGLTGVIRRGKGLEQFLFIEGNRENRVLLVAHADTVWDAHYGGNENKPQNIYEDNGIIRNRNGGLGADDRAGCAILWLLKEMGHSILITNGEEDGRIGSKWLMNENKDISDKINSHNFMVQLDRCNSNDFKCYDVGTDEFREYVIQVTNYKDAGRKASTDIVILCRDVCGVNLSVGYHNEHSKYEFLIIAEWINTLNICRKWLSESKLPRFKR